MSAAFVKSLTRQIEERMGSGAKAAAAAGVSQGRWSDYVNDTNPIHGETTIPLHRFMKVAGPDEKSALLSVWSQDFATPGDCLNTEASQVTEASAELQRVVREAKARAGDGPISQIDQARILKLVLIVHAEADDVRSALINKGAA